MGLIDQAKKDIERITSNAREFGVSMLFLAPTSETATISGLHTKHHLGIDQDGNMINSKTSKISVSEKFLTDSGYPVRNVAGEVDLRGHKVTVKDSTGSDCTYVIRQWFPDETIGLITCIMSDFE
jgi:hypothetical protein